MNNSNHRCHSAAHSKIVLASSGAVFYAQNGRGGASPARPRLLDDGAPLRPPCGRPRTGGGWLDRPRVLAPTQERERKGGKEGREVGYRGIEGEGGRRFLCPRRNTHSTINSSRSFALNSANTVSIVVVARPSILFMTTILSRLSDVFASLVLAFILRASGSRVIGEITYRPGNGHVIQTSCLHGPERR
jgi:hypothetical protein